MNIRQCRGNSDLATQSFPDIVPVSQVLFLAVWMLVPTTGRWALANAKENPSFATIQPCPRRQSPP
jgi:hypothetical protein